MGKGLGALKERIGLDLVKKPVKDHERTWIDKFEYEEYSDRGWRFEIDGVEVFSSHCYDQGQVKDQVIKSLDKAPAKLKTNLKGVYCLQDACNQVIKREGVQGFAVSKYGFIFFGGDGNFVQDIPTMTESTFIHELGHLVNPKTGGAPSELEEPFYEALKKDMQKLFKLPEDEDPLPDLECEAYQASELSKEFWCNLLSSQLVKPHNIEFTKTTPDGKTTVRSIAFSEAYPRASRLVQNWLAV